MRWGPTLTTRTNGIIVDGRRGLFGNISVVGYPAQPSESVGDFRASKPVKPPGISRDYWRSYGILPKAVSPYAALCAVVLELRSRKKRTMGTESVQNCQLSFVENLPWILPAPGDDHLAFNLTVRHAPTKAQYNLSWRKEFRG